MNNSKERTGLNRMKRFFCLMMVAMLAVSMLPVTGVAAKEVDSASGDIIVEGTPSNYFDIGSNYEIKVINNNPSAVGLYLQLIYPSMSDRLPEIVSGALNDSLTEVNFYGLTFKPRSGDSWVTGMSSTFNIADNTSDTTVSTNNITLVDFTKRNITKNTTFTAKLEIVDYNVDADDVIGSPILTAYSSNDSFALTNTSITPKAIAPTLGKYTIQVELPLRYTGKGNSLSFTISYPVKNSSVPRTLDCTATIPYTVEYVEDKDDDDDDDPADTLIPYIIVDSYSYGGTSVTAGEEFTLTLRLRNTSSTHSLENIVMNVSPMGVFSMTSSSNTFFINKLQAGSILERTVTLKAGLTKVTDDEDANSIDMKFTYQYLGKDDKSLQTGNSSESITLPVDFPDRFELGIPESDDMAFAGEDFYLSVPMVNKGRSSVYNLTAFVRGDGLKNPGQTQYIGNLNAGTESSADFSLQYLEPGEYSGEIVVTYEDANMNPKEMVAVFNVSVEDMWGGGPMEPEWPDGFDPNIPAEPTDAIPETDPVRPVKIAVALVVCAMSTYVTIQKAKAKRSIYLDEDL